MKKIMLTGVSGNLSAKAAEVLTARWPAEDLVFTTSDPVCREKYAAKGVETRLANFNRPEGLEGVFSGVDTLILVSMPFVGPRRRSAHKAALDAAAAVGVKRVVYTSVVGAGEPDIDAYEVNDHIWTEQYIRSLPLHWVFLRNSQYAEAMVSSYLDALEHSGGVLSNNMGEGKMAHISRDDCAEAAACAAMGDWEDRIFDVNGPELLSMAQFVAIGNEVTGHTVRYAFSTDEENYAFFDSIGVPRTTEELWAQTASNFPYCSDGMISFGRAIRKGQMANCTEDFHALTGRRPLSVREVFADLQNHRVGDRRSTDQ